MDIVAELRFPNLVRGVSAIRIETNCQELLKVLPTTVQDKEKKLVAGSVYRPEEERKRER